MAKDSCLARKQLPHSYIALPCPFDGGPVADQLDAGVKVPSVENPDLSEIFCCKRWSRSAGSFLCLTCYQKSASLKGNGAEEGSLALLVGME